MIAQVYIKTNNLNTDKPFDYLVPEEIEDKICVGTRVKVPFGMGNSPKEAYVVSLKDKSDFSSLKSIRSITDSFPVLTESAIELCFFMRERYFCTFSEAASLMLPPGTDIKFEEWVSLAHKYSEKVPKLSSLYQLQLIKLLEENDGSCEMLQIKNALGKNARASVNALIGKGIAEKSFRDKRRAKEKTVRLVYYCGEGDISDHIEKLEKSAPKQADVLRALAELGEASVPDIITYTGAARNSVEALCAKKLIFYREVQILRNPLDGKESGCATELCLTNAQTNAVNIIKNGSAETYLIHGVTGSGKTEGYMSIVCDALKRGKQAIILVPEISLTPQITDRFFRRFGDRVAVIHSALSLGERLDEWQRIKNGDASVIIGARSAIFAPVRELGAVIIDEEHEQSYKSESSPRYHARDIAAFIAKKHNCPLILGSATPSVESYYKATDGEYTLVELGERFNKKPLPEVYIADMREELREGNRTVLSRLLACELNENIKNKEQSILLLNRRGYSTFVSCRDCGIVFTCPSCSVSLTYHKNTSSLTCHYCGHREDIPSICPQCQSTRVRDFGKGTQKAEEQIEDIFPEAKIIRMDADTTSGKRGHEKILDKFSDEKTDILLGTQMVSKGLDFENVTLVGVLSADASLNVDDFRAQERTFNLITQVCGRAGRGEKPGRAVIQTYEPDNPTLMLAAKQDYKAFYEEEIEYRRAFCYPPFCDIITVTISSTDMNIAENAAQKTANEIKVALNEHGDCTFYGPSPAPLKKLQDKYRYRIWFKCNASDLLIKKLRDIVHGNKTKAKNDLSIVVDINPLSMI